MLFRSPFEEIMSKSLFSISETEAQVEATLDAEAVLKDKEEDELEVLV